MTNKQPGASASFFMSQSDLKRIGMDEVAYVKKYNVRGQVAYVVHAADGTALAMQNNANAAYDSARGQELELVSVH